MRIRKGNLVKHNITGATATVESVNSRKGTFMVRGSSQTYYLSDFTIVPRKAGRPKADKPSANAFLEQITAFKVPVPTNGRELAINGVIGLISLLASNGGRL